MTKWVTKKLGEICEKITDGSHDSPKPVDDGYYMPSVKDMRHDNFDFSDCKQISKNDFERLKGTGCKPEIGDVLIAKDGSILKYCFVVEQDLPIVILSSIAILRPDKSIIDGKFLSYYFQKEDVVTDVVENYKSGTGVPRIVLRNFEQIEIPYPESLAEQRRIAGILSSADGAIAASEALIEKYRNIKRGLLTTLLQPKEGWKTETLKDCTLKITDGCHNKPKCVERSSFIMLSSQNIQDNKLDLKDVSYLTEEDFERENARTNVKAGDVLLTIVGTVGRTYLVKETDFRFTLQRSVAVLSPNTQLIESEFLLYYLNHSIPLLENEAHGCAQKGIYLKQLGDMPISYPKDRTEQKRIASILSSIDAKIDAEMAVVEKYKGVKKGLMEEMMKRKGLK